MLTNLRMLIPPLNWSKLGSRLVVTHVTMLHLYHIITRLSSIGFKAQGVSVRKVKLLPMNDEGSQREEQYYLGLAYGGRETLTA